MCGRLADISRLRISECDGLDAEAGAEIESGSIERYAGDGSPKIELIAGLTAVKALEEMARDVNGEAGMLVVVV